jgi:hypothetical protein
MDIFLTSRTARIGIVCLTFFTIVFASDQNAGELESKSVEDPVSARGLNHYEPGQGLTEEAVGYANQLLLPENYQLIPAWKPIASDDSTSEGNPVQVYSVSSGNDDILVPAAVPKGCRCIFVNTKSLITWSGKNYSGEGRLELNAAYLLAFMLLHEVGHIDQDTSAVKFANGKMSQLNIAPSLAKEKEEEADKFAAELVRSRSRNTEVSDASLTANWIAYEISKMSWNMQVYRTIDEFGSSVTGNPSVYFDSSYSHPNLAWRILRSNHLIQQTEDTADLLRTFEAIRYRETDTSPIYRRAN